MSSTSVILIAWAVLALVVGLLAKNRILRRALVGAIVASSLGYAMLFGGMGRRLIGERLADGDLRRPYAKGVGDLVGAYSPYVFGSAANTIVLGILLFVRRKRSD